MTEETKTDNAVAEKVEVKKERNTGFINLVCSIVFSLLVIGTTIGFAFYFNSKVVNLYENNLKIYSNFIESLEAVDNDTNSNLLIKFDEIYAKDETSKNQLKEPSVLKEGFMSEYYQVQSNWLNTWLSALGIILAIFGIIIPVMFIRFYDDKKEEITQLCNKIEEMRKEYKGDLDKLIEKTTSLQTKMQENISSIDKKKSEIDEDIGRAKDRMSNELKEVREYVDKAKESENLAKSYGLGSQAAALINKKDANERDYSEALDLLNQAVNLNNKNASFYNGRCICYALLKKYKDAVDNAKKAYKLSNNRDYQYNLVEAYIFNGDIKEACETLEDFIKNNSKKYILKKDKPIWTAELNKYPDDGNAQKILELIKTLPER